MICDGNRPKARGPKRLVAGRLWIESDGETLLSWARVTLLERIDQLGSMAAAARSMGISYPKAWRLVTEMNARFPRPLVTLSAGGRAGGGARLTPAGRKVAVRFRALLADFETWLAGRRL